MPSGSSPTAKLTPLVVLAGAFPLLRERAPTLAKSAHVGWSFFNLRCGDPAVAIRLIIEAFSVDPEA
jgi:hypothetical protein